MSFIPILPMSGYSGWAFLQRTKEAQEAAHARSPELKADQEYFAKNISSVETPADLIGDYRLLKVALTAFGLAEDLPNKAFIQKVLQEGSIDPESFANRMVDKRYLALTRSFGFDLGTPNTKLSEFADNILGAYRERSFEISVGDQNSDFRLGLSMSRELGRIAATNNTDDGMWYAVMGNEPVRKVFETALDLPSAVAQLDIDEQLGIFKKKAQQLLGDHQISQFKDPEKIDSLTRTFLVKSELKSLNTAMSSGSIALMLLQN